MVEYTPMQRNKLSYWWQFLILCRCYSGHRNLMVVPGGRFMGKTVSSFYNSALNGDYVDVRWRLEDLTRSPSDRSVSEEEPRWKWWWGLFSVW